MAKAKQDSAKADEGVKDESQAKPVVETTEEVKDLSNAEELEAKQDSAKADEGDADSDSNHTTYVSVELAIEQLSAIKSEFVKVLIKYPEDWNKKKFFIDGDTRDVHKNNAEIFIKQGIATLVTK